MLNPVRYWYQKTHQPIIYLLLPLACLFRAIVKFRSWLYARNVLKKKYFSVPVMVVGNITVGGTGKTPLVIWLAEFLKSQGFRPGIVSRGVGGKKHHEPYLVTEKNISAEVGDEAILLFKRTACPLAVCTNRVAAVSHLLQNTDCNIIISDDGLQHYRLGRQIEIAVVDGVRRFGNEYFLPAGPLRESITRLKAVDFVIVNGVNNTNELGMQLVADKIIALNSAQEISVSDFPRQKIHVVAGIGHPERFFSDLKKEGFDVIAHAFPDHYSYKSQDLYFKDNYPILMTEKDAVKCFAFTHLKSCWYVRVTAKIDIRFPAQLLKKIENVMEKSDELQKNNSQSTHRFNSVFQHNTFCE